MKQIMNKDESQPIPVNQDEKDIENFYEADLLKEKQKTNYWKKRCEAAERNLETYSNWLEISLEDSETVESHNAYEFWQQAWKEWQQLKSNPEPTPVQEGLREDDLLNILVWYQSKGDQYRNETELVNCVKDFLQVHPEKKEK